MLFLFQKLATTHRVISDRVFFGAGHLQWMITTRDKKKPGLNGSLGGNGKINYPYSRAQTYRILAPDRGPRGWGNIWVIVTWNCNFCHWFIARSANFRQTFLHINMTHYGGSLRFITAPPHLVPLGVKIAFLCFGGCQNQNFYIIKCIFFGLKWKTSIIL